MCNTAVCIYQCVNVHDYFHGYICVCMCMFVYYVTGGKQASVASQIWHCAVTALHRFPKGKSDLEKHKLCRTTGWILNTEENWFRCVDVYFVLSKTNPYQGVKSNSASVTCLILSLNRIESFSRFFDCQINQFIIESNNLSKCSSFECVLVTN